MRLAFCVLLTAVGTCAAHAQELPNWEGPYLGVYGAFSGGQSAQHDDLPAPVGVRQTRTPPTSTPTPPTTPNPTLTPPPVANPTPTPPPVVNPPQLLPADGRYGVYGGLGGGVVGYNLLVRRLILGAEADFGGGSISGASASCGLTPHACGTSIGFVSDYRLRLGLPLGRFLPFVAGGLALDDIRAYDTQAAASGSALRAGYTVGGGIDYRIDARWSLRLEYLHQGFGASRLFSAAPGFPETVWASTNIARIGITYAFRPEPAPVIAKY